MHVKLNPVKRIACYSPYSALEGWLAIAYISAL